MVGLKIRKSEAPGGTAEAAEASLQSYVHLAEAAYHLGQLEKCADLLSRALAVAKDLGEDDPWIARIFNRMALLQSRQGRHSEAERLLKRAVAILERSNPRLDAELATFLSNLGTVYRQIDKTGMARAAFERALSIAEEAASGPEISVAWILDQLGDLDAAANNASAALFSLRRSLTIKEQVVGPDNWDTAVTLARIGELFLKLGRYNEAEPYLLRVVDIRERVLGWTDPTLAKPLARLAYLYAKQRKDGRAEQIIRYALKLFAEVLPPDHPDILGCLNLLSEIYRGLGRYSDADSVWQLAQELVDGRDSRKRIARLTFPNPPRLSPPATPAYEAGV